MISLKDIQQVTERESQETHINIDYFEKKIRIYTNRATVMKRMLKVGYKPSRIERIQGKICSMSFEFESKEIGKFLRTTIFKFD